MSTTQYREFNLLDNDIPFRGRWLIEASAGTGKTYNLSGLFVRLVAEDVLGAAEDPSQIVVVTYTRAATRELRERIVQRLRGARDILNSDRPRTQNDDPFLEQLKHRYREDGEAQKNLARAVQHIDELSVYTIHGFTHRLLQEFGPRAHIDFTGDVIADQSEITSELIYDYWRRLVSQADDHLPSRAILNMLQEENGTPEEFVRQYSHLLSDPSIDYKRDISWDALEDQLDQMQTILSDLQKGLTADRRHAIKRLFCRNKPDNLQLNGRYFKEEKWQTCRSELRELELAETPLELDPGEWSALHYVGRDSIESKINKDGTFEHLEVDGETEQWMERLEELMEKRESYKSQKADLLQAVLADLSDRYTATIDERDEYSYDDILYQADRMVRNNKAVREAIRNKYPISLIDEFQDTDPLQWSMFDTLYDPSVAEKTFMCLIGDPKQSIYRFRGADVNAYLKARESVDPKNRFTLSRNWRSDRPFIEALNRLWGKEDHAFYTPEIAYKQVEYPQEKPEQEPPADRLAAVNWIVEDTDQASLNKTDARLRAAEITARHIKQVLADYGPAAGRSDDKTVNPADIAVLCGTNREAALIKRNLSDEGLNSVQLSRENVFDSAEARELQLLLESAVEPSNTSRLRSALGTRMLGGADLLVQLREEEETGEDLRRQWETWMGRVLEWHRLWREEGLTPMLRRAFEQSGCIRNLIQYADGERRVTNLHHLTDLLQEIARERPGEQRYLLNELRRRRREAGDRNAMEEEELRLESDRDLVNIVTIHRSKGLEYPIVYTPFLWDGINLKQLDKDQPWVFHPSNGENATRKLMDVDGSQYPGSDYRYFREEFEDELRTAYVGLTRAEHHTIVVHMPYSGNYGEGSPKTVAAIDYLLMRPARYRQMLANIFDSIREEPGEGITYGEVVEQLEALDQDTGAKVFQLQRWTDDKGGAHGQDRWEASEQDTLDPERVLEFREFKSRSQLGKAWTIQSYSSLRRGVESAGHSEMEGYNVQMDDPGTEGETEEPPQKEKEEIDSMHTFPAGARTGLCWHRIYEEISFQEAEKHKKEIHRQLSAHGFDAERWTPVLRDHVQVTLNKPLKQAGGCRLGGLEERQVNKEMEFYFGVGAIEVEEIMGIIRSDVGPLPSRDRMGGLMNGYIDLTFEYDGKIYLLDYKSNYLGGSSDAYDSDALAESIHEHYYDLQYHLYTLALHRYLRQRIGRSYGYDSHFGGVFYLYLRGMERGGSANGIFFDRPDENVIKEMDQYFDEGSG